MRKLQHNETRDISSLKKIIKRLRDPISGCDWDKIQTFDSIAAHTLEEAYEVIEAIEQNDMDSLKDELGDLLLQVLYYSCIAEEKDLFTFNDVLNCICDKMIRRHPHIFEQGDRTSKKPPQHDWEYVKSKERNKNSKQQTSVFDGIEKTLPSLLRARKLQKRAASVGFDWPNYKGALDKLYEELGELKNEINKGADGNEKIMDELGDILFSTVNLARKLGTDAEMSLRKGNTKFERRFRYIEKKAEENKISVKNLTLNELEDMWISSKSMYK